MREEICAICGFSGSLSKEHTPPRKAFNDNNILLQKIDKEKTVAEVRWKEFKKQGGNFEFTLCEKCNNNTGGWYGSAYVAFTKKCAEFAHQSNGGKIISISVDLFPSRVIKQALAILCSSCGPNLSERSQDLRKIILNKNYCLKPENLDIWLYIRAQGGGRSSGITGVLNTKTGKSQVIAEFSWWPIGWVLSFNDNVLSYLTNVTDWCCFDYNEKRSFSLNVNCNWAATAFPLDYRDPDTVEKESKQNK